MNPQLRQTDRELLEENKALQSECERLRKELRHTHSGYEIMQEEADRLRKDKARLDWLADPDNIIGNVELPEKAVLENVHCMRSAIDAAMKGGGE